MRQHVLRRVALTLGVMIVFALVFYLIAGRQVAAFYNKQDHSEVALKQGTAFLKGGLEIHPFSLKDGDGHIFTNSSLTGHWSLLFFGFTRCPMVCPTTLSEMSKAYRLLEKMNAKQLPQVVFISVDPERDTLEDIKEYVLSFNKHFIGATGSQANLGTLTRNLGVMYAQAKKSGESDYQVTHSDTIIAINPQGHWAGVLTPPYDASIMADDFLKMQSL